MLVTKRFSWATLFVIPLTFVWQTFSFTALKLLLARIWSDAEGDARIPADEVEFFLTAAARSLAAKAEVIKIPKSKTTTTGTNLSFTEVSLAKF